MKQCSAVATLAPRILLLSLRNFACIFCYLFPLLLLCIVNERNILKAQKQQLQEKRKKRSGKVSVDTKKCVVKILLNAASSLSGSEHSLCHKGIRVITQPSGHTYIRIFINN